MPDVDPYQPPKSDVAKSNGEPAFRQGMFFVVKRGYTAPRVCYFTGADVGEVAQPMKINMRKNLGVGYFVYLVIVINAVIWDGWESISLWWAIAAVGLANLATLAPDLINLPFFRVYCGPNLRKKFMIKSVIGNILSSFGLFLVLIGNLETGVFYLVLLFLLAQ